LIIVSACLVGLKSRYDGSSKPKEELIKLLTKGKVIPLCPEQLGGLPTPRLPAEILFGDGTDVVNGKSKVIRKDGIDITEQFIKGAKQVLQIALLIGAKKAILKDGSPSCGVNFIKRKGVIVKGMGVTTTLLKNNGIKVISSDSF